MRDLYEKAIDLDNPKRYLIKLDPEMYGRISNKVCSYDLMNNQKYECVEQCLEVLEEDLGETLQEIQLKKLKTFSQSMKTSNQEISIKNTMSQ